jgi:hypothetical protein
MAADDSKKAAAKQAVQASFSMYRLIGDLLEVVSDAWNRYHLHVHAG